jgi:glycine/D-amino acid oxidase-like deaminating enzyme
MTTTTKYGRSPWIDRFPKSRVPSYPRHRGRLDIDVAIVGGGLTGCATAYAFAAAGIKVTLVEAGLIGRGSSGASAGWIAGDPGASFVEVAKAHGLRSARQGWQAWHRAALDFGALVRRLALKCYFEPRDTLVVATTPEHAAGLKRKLKARRDAGLEASFVNARTIGSEAALTAEAGIRSRDGATLDPYRAAIGLAAAAAARGVQIFERSAATRTKFTRKTAEIETVGGTIRTKRIIITTGMPTALFKSLTRHFWFQSSFLALTEPLPAKIRAQLGRRSIVLRDAATPPHLVRWVDDERLLVSGADAETVPGRQRDNLIVQRTGQLMYELSTIYPDISGTMPAYGWEAPYVRTADGLPYIGPHRNYPHHLFAFGDSSHSVTGAYLASRILLRHYLKELDRADEVFAFTRIPR